MKMQKGYWLTRDGGLENVDIHNPGFSYPWSSSSTGLTWTDTGRFLSDEDDDCNKDIIASYENPLESVTIDSTKSFIKNCHIVIGRNGINPMLVENGKAILRLDGYTILPTEIYEKLTKSQKDREYLSEEKKKKDVNTIESPSVMTMRDKLAMAVVSGIHAGIEQARILNKLGAADIAKEAYIQADAMMEARNTRADNAAIAEHKEES